MACLGPQSFISGAPPLDSDDIKDVDLSKCHNLSGPISIEGAEPGDCLIVDILDGAL
jgi:acetamidase/formamidase